MLTSQVGEDVGVSGSDVLGVLSLEGAAWTALSIQKNSIRNEIMMISLLNTRIGKDQRSTFFLDEKIWKPLINVGFKSVFYHCFYTKYTYNTYHYVQLLYYMYTCLVCGFTTYYV